MTFDKSNDLNKSKINNTNNTTGAGQNQQQGGKTQEGGRDQSQAGNKQQGGRDQSTQGGSKKGF